MIKIKIIIVPSSLSIFLSSLAKKYKTVADKVIMNISIRLKLLVVTLPRRITGNPRTKPMLKIFVPIMLPRMISNSPFLAEVMARIISGDEVPITKMIIVISF